MDVLQFLKPAPHKEGLPEESIDPTYKKLRWQVFFGIFIGYAGYYLVRKNFSLAMPDLIERGYTKTQIGVAISAIAIAYGISKFAMAIKSDRSNARIFLPLGLMLSAFTMSAMGILPFATASVGIMFVFLFINGWVQGMGWPPSGRVMVHWFSQKERGTKMSFWNLAHNVGGFLMPLLAVAGAGLFGVWQGKLYFPAIIALLIAMVAYLLIRDTPQSCGLPPIEDTADSVAPEFKVRKADDIVLLSSTLSVSPVVIAGFVSDLIGGDDNYEYVQLLATKDINFATTPFSVVVCNNAGAALANSGWATGVNGTVYRSYKFNLTSGTAAKGTYFYVGGTNKMLNGTSSTSMASLNWVRTINYVSVRGDGFGPTTSGLFANSGNTSGVAVFQGTTVTLASVPIDVIMVATGGSILDGTTPPAWGYRIANTDWYDIKNPITLEDQPFFRMGTNTINLRYNTPGDAGFYNILGGIYNTTLGRWTTARSQINMLLTKTSPVDTIQGVLATKIVE